MVKYVNNVKIGYSVSGVSLQLCRHMTVLWLCWDSSCSRKGLVIRQVIFQSRQVACLKLPASINLLLSIWPYCCHVTVLCVSVLPCCRYSQSAPRLGTQSALPTVASALQLPRTCTRSKASMEPQLWLDHSIRHVHNVLQHSSHYSNAAMVLQPHPA